MVWGSPRVDRGQEWSLVGFLEVADTHVRMKVETGWEVSKSADTKGNVLSCHSDVSIGSACTSCAIGISMVRHTFVVSGKV